MTTEQPHGAELPVEARVGRPKPCDEPCPKCGSSDVWREFWGKDAGRDAKNWATTEGKYERADGHRLFATRDHLRNTCRCCQYYWKSLPLKKPNDALTRAANGNDGDD